MKFFLLLTVWLKWAHKWMRAHLPVALIESWYHGASWILCRPIVGSDLHQDSLKLHRQTDQCQEPTYVGSCSQTNQQCLYLLGWRRRCRLQRRHLLCVGVSADHTFLLLLQNRMESFGCKLKDLGTPKWRGMQVSAHGSQSIWSHVTTCTLYHWTY